MGLSLVASYRALASGERAVVSIAFGHSNSQCVLTPRREGEGANGAAFPALPCDAAGGQQAVRQDRGGTAATHSLFHSELPLRFMEGERG